MNKLVDLELEKILKGNPKINLKRACRIEDGIEKLSKNQFTQFQSFFDSNKSNHKITFFTPASGSGSRMFGALYDFLDNSNTSSQEVLEFVELILHRIKQLPFYNYLPQNIKKNLKKGNVDIQKVIDYIVNENGLNYGHLPKGLIPFHTYGKFILNPFQEQIIQGITLVNEEVDFHFTINPNFESKIADSLNILSKITGLNFSYSFSEQNESTHSTAFNQKNEVAMLNGVAIKRPSGHGALLENLNQIDSDLIFIRNIDNIQHANKAKSSIKTKKALGGILLDFQNRVKKLLTLIDNEQDFKTYAHSINSDFNLNLKESQLNDSDFLKTFFNKPIRVCGMVKNEGQAGGGPFWVEDEQGHVTKQIVEKSQIDKSQLSIMLNATHFNPVDIVCWVKDYKGNKFDLDQYSNKDLYFIVNKTQFGVPIKYIEKPGLWNGAMYNWLTLFYEIDSKCFSPVKTVADLLKSPHQEE